MLMVSTRMQGSIAERLSDEQMQALRSEGERLRAETDDELAIARFRAADAFFVFWVGGDSIADEELIVAGEARAREALELAQKLGDANLISACMDALGGLAFARRNLKAALDFAIRRLEYEDRLNLQERMDAYAMVGWNNSLLGNLSEAERYTARGLAQLQPGQAHTTAMHVLAWRLYCLSHLGRWDEVVTTLPRLVELWEEAGDQEWRAAVDDLRNRMTG